MQCRQQMPVQQCPRYFEDCAAVMTCFTGVHTGMVYMLLQCCWVLTCLNLLQIISAALSKLQTWAGTDAPTSRSDLDTDLFCAECCCSCRCRLIKAPGATGLPRQCLWLRQQSACLRQWQTRRRQLAGIQATAVGRLDAGDEAAASSLVDHLRNVASHLHILYKFARPHTLIGTFISICSVSLLALVSAVAFNAAALSSQDAFDIMSGVAEALLSWLSTACSLQPSSSLHSKLVAAASSSLLNPRPLGAAGSGRPGDVCASGPAAGAGSSPADECLHSGHEPGL